MAFLNQAALTAYPQSEGWVYSAVFPEDVHVSRYSRYIELEHAFLELRNQLAALRSLTDNWDTEGAPAPNEAAFAAAQRALGVFRAMDVRPTQLMPSADGGIGILFVEGEQYAHIEFENFGDIWALTYGPNSPAATWQVPSTEATSLRDAWNKISASLRR